MQAPTSLPPIDEVSERYTLLERIGEGTFAITYRARDVVLDRIVALKLLRPQYAADATFLARFSREARAAAKVNHPNVVHVYDYGTRDDTPFLVLQYVPGRDLKESLVREGPRPPEEAVRFAHQILQGLEAIHREGLIHRDIKPQNILLDFDQTARVTDFGIAHNPANSLLTGYGTTLGTPSYMAPEQARGEAVTKAADLYSVGVVLFELLTGRLPFTGENPLAVMLAHVQDPPPAPTEFAPNPIPPGLDAVVLRALAKDPKDRFLSAADMAYALEASLNEPANELTSTVVMPPITPTNGYTPVVETPPLSPPAEQTTVSPPTFPRPRLAEPAGRRGRRLAWFAPLAVGAIVLAVLGGVMALDGGDDGGNSSGRLAAMPTATATEPANAGAASEATTAVLAVDLETDTPTATAAPPTATETATAVPTDTRTPTRTPTIAPSDGAPSETDENTEQVDGEAAKAQPVSLAFGPDQWQGGFYRGDNEFLGRPWVAIYGAQSGMGRATLTVSLDADPNGEATLTITGLDDEWDGNNPILIEVNGVEIFNGLSPFPTWDGVGDGESAAWTSVAFTVPAGTLRAGTNEIAFSNLAQSANFNSPPWVNISDTTLETH
jgi:hypothetical protein